MGGLSGAEVISVIFPQLHGASKMLTLAFFFSSHLNMQLSSKRIPFQVKVHEKTLHIQATSRLNKYEWLIFCWSSGGSVFCLTYRGKKKNERKTKMEYFPSVFSQFESSKLVSHL